MVDAADYEWIDDAFDAFILTLVETDASPEDVCVAANLPMRRVEPDVGEEAGWDNTVEFTYVARLGPWLAFQGINGYQMSLSTHLQPMSRLGRVVGYFRNVNALMSFYVADQGRLLRYFDPLLDEPGEGDGEPFPEEAGLPFGEEAANVEAASLALIERLTGQRIAEDWFSDESRQRVLISIVS